MPDKNIIITQMTQKFIHTFSNFMRSDLEEFTKYILWGESIRIISESRENINQFLYFLFENYSTRKSLLKNNSEKYFYLNLEVDPEFEITDPDRFLLNEFSTKLGIALYTIDELNNFLNEVDKNIVINLPDNLSENQLRLFLSLKFYLKDRVQFILNTIKDIPGFTRTFVLTYNKDLIKFLWEQECQNLNITDDNVPYDFIRGDMTQIRKLILQYHFEKKPILVDELNAPVVKSFLEEVVQESIQENIEETVPSINDVISFNLIQEDIPVEEKEKVAKKSNEIGTEPSFLTPREQKVYRELNKSSFITRKRISTLVWGDPNINDDAIDQFVSRFRRKFSSNGYDKDYIFVRKGEGVGISR